MLEMDFIQSFRSEEVIDRIDLCSGSSLNDARYCENNHLKRVQLDRKLLDRLRKYQQRTIFSESMPLVAFLVSITSCDCSTMVL